jgi:hypothetical protein
MRYFKKAVWLFLCGILLTAFSPLEAWSEAPKRHALLIGINEYGGGRISSLKGCHNDVRLVRELLTNRFEFASDDIRVLLDGQATHTEIIREIAALTERVEQGDIVYIHFSGHGSRTPDASDNNRLRPTLIPYGARSTTDQANSLDNYDILSDRLKVTVARISEITDNIVFVSDSCHSGTITRGTNDPDVLATRSVPDDSRPHPDIVENVPDNVTWVSVASCGTTELAREYIGDDREFYGAFTWFWVRALQSSSSGDTWQMVADRTKAMMWNAGLRSQTPVIPGDNSNREIFGGAVSGMPTKFTVTRIYPVHQINVGTFAEVSENSELRLEKEGKLTETRLIVQKADAFSSEVSVENGTVAVGDVVVLTKWEPSFPLLKVALGTDYTSDENLLDGLKNLFVVSADELAAYELVDSPNKSDMIIWVTRPKRDDDGSIVMLQTRPIMDDDGNIVGEEKFGLPESVQTEAPQIWVMDPSLNYPYNKQDALKEIPYNKTSLIELAQNLVKMSRLHGLYTMNLPGHGDGALTITYRLFTPATPREWNALPEDERLELTRAPSPRVPLRWKLIDEDYANTYDNREFKRQAEGEFGLLSIRVENRSDRSYYIYGVNATPDAMILPFLPGDPKLSTEVPPRQNKYIDFTSHLILTDDDEYVRIFVTLEPIDIHILKQEAIIASRRGEGTRSVSNPIEAMLSRQVYPTRGLSGTSAVAPADVTSIGTRFTR